MRQKSLTDQALALWRRNWAPRTRYDPCNEIAVPKRAIDRRGSNGFQVTPSDTQGRSAADCRIRCRGLTRGVQRNPFPGLALSTPPGRGWPGTPTVGVPALA